MLWIPLLRKQMYVFSKLWLCTQFKGDRKDVSSVAVLTELKNIKIKQIQREERIRRPDSVWLFKWKEVNRILKEYIFYLRLYVVFLSLFKINRIAVSFFVKKYGLHDCQPFLVLCLIFWRVRYTLEDFKKSLSSICFFNKVFIWTVYKKAFRFGRLLLGYVICFVSVYTISCCLQCRVLVILCLCTYYIIFFTSVYH